MKKIFFVLSLLISLVTHASVDCPAYKQPFTVAGLPTSATLQTGGLTFSLVEEVSKKVTRFTSAKLFYDAEMKTWISLSSTVEKEPRYDEHGKPVIVEGERQYVPGKDVYVTEAFSFFDRTQNPGVWKRFPTTGETRIVLGAGGPKVAKTATSYVVDGGTAETMHALYLEHPEAFKQNFAVDPKQPQGWADPKLMKLYYPEILANKTLSPPRDSGAPTENWDSGEMNVHVRDAQSKPALHFSSSTKLTTSEEDWGTGVGHSRTASLALQSVTALDPAAKSLGALNIFHAQGEGSPNGNVVSSTAKGTVLNLSEPKTYSSFGCSGAQAYSAPAKSEVNSDSASPTPKPSATPLPKH